MKIRILVAFLLLGLTINFISCKEPDSLGLDLVENKLQSSSADGDTITLLAHSLLKDSLITYKYLGDPSYSNLYGYHLVGNYDDPTFGKVKSSIYTQFNINGTSPNFGDNPHVDSVVLQLFPASRYGNTSQDMNFKVYEIEEDLIRNEDSAYYTFSKVEHNLIPILDSTFAPVFGGVDNDSIYVDTNKVPFHFRLRLDNTFGDELLALSETQAYTSYEEFVKQFKGLYIETDENMGGGSLLYINLESSYTQLVVYYNDSLDYSFPINDACVAFTSSSHDYSFANSNLKDQLDGDTTIGMEYLFVQPLSAIETKIKIPHLNTWHERTDIGINNARLVLEVDELSMVDTATYPLPKQLSIKRKNEDGDFEFLIDQYVENNIDGTYYKSENAYIFNVTRYIQNMILNNENEDDLYIAPSGAAVTGNNVVLKGPKREDGGLKLKLIYTKL